MISERLRRRWYPPSRPDLTVQFYQWIREALGPTVRLLNLGAGPPDRDPVRLLKGRCARVVGADIDPAVLGNDECDETVVIDELKPLPFDPASFDVVLSDYVMEHVRFPRLFLEEVFRVLKPGGSFFFRTPNRNHYVAQIAWWTPQWFHLLVANPSRGKP